MPKRNTTMVVCRTGAKGMKKKNRTMWADIAEGASAIAEGAFAAAAVAAEAASSAAAVASEAGRGMQSAWDWDGGEWGKTEPLRKTEGLGQQTPALEKKATTTPRSRAAMPQHQFSPAADAFAAALEAVPADDWGRTWASDRTLMLRGTSKRFKDAVDKLRPPTIVKSNTCQVGFVVEASGKKMGPGKCVYSGQLPTDTVKFLTQLEKMTSRCRIATLDLATFRQDAIKQLMPREMAGCGMRCQDAGVLVGVLAQCPMLSELRLGGNIMGAEGAGMLAGVLPQCPALSHLDLRNNNIGDSGAGSLAGVLPQCPLLAHLNLDSNQIGDNGAGSLAGVLSQCQALSHLELSDNEIEDEGAGRLAGVLPQCLLLSSLDLSGNELISDEGAEILRAAWSGEPDQLILSHEDEDEDETTDEGDWDDEEEDSEQEDKDEYVVPSVYEPADASHVYEDEID
jgi:hypothetical protein